jgi:hypothetical protein
MGKIKRRHRGDVEEEAVAAQVTIETARTFIERWSNGLYVGGNCERERTKKPNGGGVVRAVAMDEDERRRNVVGKRSMGRDASYARKRKRVGPVMGRCQPIWPRASFWWHRSLGRAERAIGSGFWSVSVWPNF